MLSSRLRKYLAVQVQTSDEEPLVTTRTILPYDFRNESATNNPLVSVRWEIERPDGFPLRDHEDHPEGYPYYPLIYQLSAGDEYLVGPWVNWRLSPDGVFRFAEEWLKRQGK